LASYKEARDEYERLMGRDLGSIYHLLWNETAYLFMRWDEYVAMFGKDQEQFDIMNEVAPGFFKSVQDALWEKTLLHLCRFADPSKVAHRRTLSLDALLTTTTCSAIPELSSLVATAKGKIKFAQDWRNRSLAHLDLDYALERSAKPLAPASRAHVREALSSIKDVLEKVDQHFTGSSLHFGGVGFNWGGNHLLSEMKFISKLRSEREDRINNGEATQDDYDWAKWH